MNEISSMTGYACVSKDVKTGTLTLELKSLNHRYLDVQFRIPDELRFIEGNLRELMANTISRGKLECRISYVTVKNNIATGQLNTVNLTNLNKLNLLVKEHVTAATPMSITEILKWPGILSEESIESNLMQETLVGLAKAALVEFRETRVREGQKLKAMLLDRVEIMENLTSGISEVVPQLIVSYQEKLSNKLKEILGNPNDERLNQELAMFIAKIDVDEELSRLQTHLIEVKRILHKGGSCGKRLDFLMQELNREANTLGSKSISVEISKTSIELKVLIEQMREQIQNIE